MKNNNYKLKIERRISVLEEKYKAIAQDIAEIKLSLNNHITDISKQLIEIRDAINKRPSWFITGLVSILVMLMGILLGIILSSTGLK